MQEHWEKYKKPLEGKPATIAFNADFIDECDGYEYMYVGFVKVALKNPKEDGLVSEDEVDMIAQIEDRLEFEALRWRVGKYVGMIVTDGHVNFIYYLKFDFEWSNAVSEAMKHFDYPYTYGSSEDMQGNVYKNILYPNPLQWQIINNHHACHQLASQGDTLTQKRAIEHKAYFQNKEDQAKFLGMILEEGFKKMEELEPKEGYGCGVSFFRLDTPNYYEIDDITLYLINKAQECNGAYDGWECSVVKS